jgi:two-component system CheB/CheR fusion protein
MSRLIKEVLEYSKLAHTSKGYVPTNLDTILKAVLSDLDLLLSENNVTVMYSDALPTVDAIPLQMSQLFYNLLTNAIKFQIKLSPPVIIVSFRWLSKNDLVEHAELKNDLSFLEIKFSDNGIGFDPEFAEQIFQLFERLHSVDEYEGTGMGLALCKKIVENHNGKIYATSREGEGASFYVLLPATQVVASQ